MILVVGATGQLGSAVTRLLLSQGNSVRILVRPNSDYRELVEAGAQPVTGDLKDRASLDAACEGVEYVITTANSAMRGGDDNPFTVEMEGNRNLIDAAQAAGVKQFIFVSAAMADAQSEVPFVAGKGQTDAHLQACGMTYTIIAPEAFMDIWVNWIVGGPALTGQTVTLVGSGARKHSFIAMKDVAAFTVAALGNPSAINQRLVIGGPEPLSFLEAVAVYEKVLGRPVPVRCVNPGEPVPGIPDTVLPMVAAFDFYDSPVDMTAAYQTYGVEPTSLETFARETLAAGAA